MTLKSKQWLLRVMLFVFAGTLFASEQKEPIEIIVGHTHLLDYDNVTRVAIGNPDVADFKILKDSKQILFFGVKEGITDLRIWTSDGNDTERFIQVFTESPVDKLGKVTEFLKDIEGIEINQHGSDIIIHGNALTADDYKRIQFIADQYGAKNLVVSNALTPENMVLMDVKVLEIRRSALKDLGVDWENRVNGPSFGYVKDFHANNAYRIGGPIPVPGLNQEDGLSFTGINTAITSSIDLLAENGLAKFLAEPKLTCMSGGQANFVAGGEIPIPIINDNGSVGVEFKQYGVILGMQPVVDPSGFIRTKIEVEVSSVDDAVVVQGIPGFTTRRTETEMNGPSGETLVISGLLQNNQSKTVTKLPGLGDIPILGELFKSRSFSNQDSELVIFVTPSLIGTQTDNNTEWLDYASDLETTINEPMRFKLKD